MRTCVVLLDKRHPL